MEKWVLMEGKRDEKERKKQEQEKNDAVYM